MESVEVCYFNIILVGKVFYDLVDETNFFLAFLVGVDFILQQVKVWKDSIKVKVVDLLKEFARSLDIGLHLLCLHNFFIDLKFIWHRFKILSEKHFLLFLLGYFFYNLHGEFTLLWLMTIFVKVVVFIWLTAAIE